MTINEHGTLQSKSLWEYKLYWWQLWIIGIDRDFAICPENRKQNDNCFVNILDPKILDQFKRS
jgi:hypothetical protein